MSSRQQLAEAIRILTAVLNGIPDAPVKETRPAAPAASERIPSGWAKAKIKAISDKEVETKRGPSRKVSLRLAWVQDGESHEVWAGTFSEAVIADFDACGASKGDNILVKLAQNGEYWNLMGIALSATPGIKAEEVPF